MEVSKALWYALIPSAVEKLAFKLLHILKKSWLPKIKTFAQFKPINTAHIVEKEKKWFAKVAYSFEHLYYP